MKKVVLALIIPALLLSMGNIASARSNRNDEKGSDRKTEHKVERSKPPEQKEERREAPKVERREAPREERRVEQRVERREAPKVERREIPREEPRVDTRSNDSHNTRDNTPKVEEKVREPRKDPVRYNPPPKEETRRSDSIFDKNDHSSDRRSNETTVRDHAKENPPPKTDSRRSDSIGDRDNSSSSNRNRDAIKRDTEVKNDPPKSGGEYELRSTRKKSESDTGSKDSIDTKSLDNGSGSTESVDRTRGKTVKEGWDKLQPPSTRKARTDKKVHDIVIDKTSRDEARGNNDEGNSSREIRHGDGPKKTFKAPEIRREMPKFEHKSSDQIHRSVESWNRSRSSSHEERIPNQARDYYRNDSHRNWYDKVVHRIGYEPHNRYYFAPRRHQSSVVLIYYYPHYVTIYRTGCYQSAYWLYGWSPHYLDPSRCVVSDYDYIYRPDPVERTDYDGISKAKVDLQDAFIYADMGLFDKHLSSEDIRICFDGEYNYSIPSEDFYAMSSDMISSIETTSLNFDKTVWLSPREVYTTALQEFRDPDGEGRSLYLSFRLRKMDGEWQIVEYGSSADPISNRYNDFRY